MKQVPNLEKSQNFQWKRILLIKPNYTTKGWDFYNVNFPPLNLAYIASYLSDLELTVKILDAKVRKLNNKQIRKKIEKYKPDVVGISVFVSAAITICYDIAKIVKDYNQNCTVVFGGRHPTFIPDETLKAEDVDIVVRGEGELTFRELIIKGSPENIKGISYKINGNIIHNEDRPLMSKNEYAKIRFPDRQLLKNVEYKIIRLHLQTIETSRGCPYSCKFCTTPTMNNGLWRPRIVENIISELKMISQNRKITDIFFVDDNLTVDTKRIEELCERIIESKKRGEINNFKFFAQVRVDDVVRAPKMVKTMADAGFWLLFIGIESASEESLKEMKKQISFNTVLKAIEIIHKNRIVVIGNLILGIDLNATEEDIKKEIQFMKKVDVDVLSYVILTPYPGSITLEELEEKNLVITKDWSRYTSFNPVIKTRQLSPVKLHNLLLYSFHELGYFRSYLATSKRIIKKRSITFFLNPRRLILFINSFLQSRSLSVKLHTFSSDSIRKLLLV
ncbi:MAG: radical SAM protein [Candidatus Lokiarchaeia archaeon]